MLTLNMICSLQLPEEARELDKELRQITKEKNEAVRSQDFEKVQSYVCDLVLLHFFFCCCIVEILDDHAYCNYFPEM